MNRIPTKPKDAAWTDEQWKAIWATGQDILVSAAAGSGKTAVLVNRMIEKVISEDNPIDVDELLVVTFTNDAAAEMRHRLADALEKEIAKDPHNDHLRKQLSLVNKAQISTLHSFCLSVVRQYAYMLDIDPGFRIASEGEISLLKDDVLKEVMEEAYSAEDDEEANRIYRLVDSFTSDRDDQEIEKLINDLYDNARVHPEPEKWLQSLVEQYHVPDGATVDDLPFIGHVKNAIEFQLEEARSQLMMVRKYALMPDGPAPYGETAEFDLALIGEAFRRLRSSWQEAYEFFSGLKWKTLARVPKDSCDEELKKKAQDKRKKAKDIIGKIQETYFARKPERLIEEIRLMAPTIETLVELTMKFGKKFKEAKLEKGILDFSDMEHYALEILAVEEEGQLKPSPVALEFQKRFKEVLVDEYQDTNMLQETILQLVKSGDEQNGNLFMVGDVKQSIYRFRLAEPMLFLNKYLTFEEEPKTSGMKIDLNANFRSRKEILHGTNYIFGQVMGEKVGEIVYDEKAALKPRAPYNDEKMPVELVVIHEEQPDASSENGMEEDPELLLEEEMKKSQQEARYIIARIRELMESGATVYDAKQKDPTKRIRPLRYSDIVILMRSMTWSNDMIEEFKKANIPLYAESSQGYFDSLEVMIMMNLLKVIDNPYQDIPLASVLRAPFVGLTENEMAIIRLAEKNAPFYEAVKKFVENEHSGLETKTQAKLERFLSQLNTWRDLARRGSLADLIWRIYLDTKYYEMVGAMSNGKQRQANLRALHDRALTFEKSSFRGLFRFLRFIDRMKARGEDLGIAKSIGEKDDVVRLMTIHSSKGLEFPVVFVAGLGNKFNLKDFNEPYLFDQKFGLAVKAIDPDNRIMYTSLPFLAMKEKKKMELIAEEMRILYVAMTRAKERLILVGSVKDWQKARQSWCEMQELPADDMLPDYVRARAKNYLDWIGPAVSRHACFKEFSDGSYIPVEHPSDWKISVISNEAFLMKQEETQESEKEEQSSEVDETLLEELNRRFMYVYPFEKATKKKSKTSVSEMKRIESLRQDEETEYVEYMKLMAKNRSKSLVKRPLFLQEKQLTAAEIGTAMHTVMQHVPQQGFERAEEACQFLEGLAEKQLITEQELQAIEVEKLLQFFETPIGKRFKNAHKLYREVPFTLNMKDGDGDSQIVQGIVDCLMQDEEGKWVLLDYKTDQILPSFAEEEALVREMVKRYGVQLRLYAEAVEKILQIRVDEKVLYLFDAGKELQLGALV
ncbi:helicase-exonuclease AddAB subunit AddA [Ureibacillus terrenus]|uniref:ATP-dependent helicase/nuclease subunit A n=2 Tax=Bacillati TaxID=1783272 RepID=A0A540V3Q2_9BACL|nr:helicase-exonuclease AddAB subunit AddA [Ureibacillus terrenus]TQE91386.1 helicase-exonuclease AddAB subunit AddA [Ureibacillus terrenus]